MKIEKQKDNEDRKFKQFTIIIDINNEDDAVDLFQIFNNSSDSRPSQRREIGKILIDNSPRIRDFGWQVKP